MGNYTPVIVLLVILAVSGVAIVRGFVEDEYEGIRPEGEDWFLLKDARTVAKTDAGEMRVVRSYGGRIVDRPMHIGFITMEPKSIFIPAYFDSTLIIFVHKGEAKLGFIYKDELVERRLKIGDVYRIPAGTPFYLMNVAEGQQLHVISSIDPSESLGVGAFQSFYIAGGTYPTSVLSGFDLEIVKTALNISRVDAQTLISKEKEGPILFLEDAHDPRMLAQYLKVKGQRLEEVEDDEDEEKHTKWSWRKILKSLFRDDNKKKERYTGKSPDSYNLFDEKTKPDFKNNNGWSIALDGSDYPPLEDSDFGVYYVHLTAGSMMAPHINPRATEYGIVLRGSGRLQVVFPNGSCAMNAEVREGHVFFVPRYFPFCQVASRSGPLEFFGFTTSARKTRPQFLAGASSILRTMMSPELAAGFRMTEEALRRIVDAQADAVILSMTKAAPPDVVNEQPEEVKVKAW